MKVKLLNEAGFTNISQASDGTLFCVTKKGRCYSGKYSAFEVKIQNGEITYESHLYSFYLRSVVVYIRDLFLKIHNLESQCLE